MTKKFDLDAAKAARLEALEEAPTVTFGGREFALPKELPFGVFVHLATMREDKREGARAVRQLMETFFGDATDEFMAQNPSMEDIEDLTKFMLSAYGYEEQEGEDALGES